MFWPFLWGSLAAGGAVAATLAAAALLPQRGRVPAAAAVGLGYAAGQAAILGWPPFPVSDTTHWLFWAALVCAGASVVEAAWPESRAARAVPRLLLPVLLTLLVSRPRLQYSWRAGEGAAWIAGIAVATSSWSFALASLGRAHAGAAFPLLLAAGAAMLAGLLAGTGSLLLGALSLALGVALGVEAVLLRVLGPGRMPEGGHLAASLLMAALWVQGWFYSDAPAYSAVLFLPVVLLALRRRWRARPVP